MCKLPQITHKLSNYSQKGALYVKFVSDRRSLHIDKIHKSNNTSFLIIPTLEQNSTFVRGC